MTRRQIHLYSLAGLGVLIVAAFIALSMLGHATMSGGPQWSAGALFGILTVGLIAVFIATILGATFVGEEIERRRRRQFRGWRVDGRR